MPPRASAACLKKPGCRPASTRRSRTWKTCSSPPPAARPTTSANGPRSRHEPAPHARDRGQGGAPAAPRPRDAGDDPGHPGDAARSEEHTSELQSLMRISYAVFCLKKKKQDKTKQKIRVQDCT